MPGPDPVAKVRERSERTVRCADEEADPKKQHAEDKDDDGVGQIAQQGGNAEKARKEEQWSGGIADRPIQAIEDQREQVEEMEVEVDLPSGDRSEGQRAGDEHDRRRAGEAAGGQEDATQQEDPFVEQEPGLEDPVEVQIGEQACDRAKDGHQNALRDDEPRVTDRAVGQVRKPPGDLTANCRLVEEELLDFIFVDAILKEGGYIALDDIGVTIAEKPYSNGGPNHILPMIFASGRYRIRPLSANVVLCEKLHSLPRRKF